MKAFVFSDAHADHVTMGVDRYADVDRAMSRVVTDAIAQKADAVFFLGDLTDPDDGPAALRASRLLVRQVRRLSHERIHVFAIPGNHDVFEDGSGENTISVLGDLDDQHVHLFSIPSLYTQYIGSGRDFSVVALPFTPTALPYDPEKFVDSVHPGGFIDHPIFIISHLAVPGVQPGEETKELPRGREVLYPFRAVAEFAMRMKGDVICLQGHYHRRQDFVAPQGYKIHIPGAMARLTMGEERHEPSYLVIET